LAELAPGGDALVSFYPSRQEALLAAMMLAQRRHAGKRPLIVNFSPEIPLIKHMVPLPYGEAGALALQLHLRKNGPRALLPGAILAEPLSVALGNRLPPAGFLKRLRRLADEFGLVLISDESRCGLGRTGALFASEHDGIVPDITVVGSGLGGGVADIVAVLLNRRMFARIVGQMKTITMPEDQRGCWGQTMLIGSAVLNALIDDGLIRNAGVVGQYLRQRLLELRQRHPQRLAAIHGRGLMIGIELRRSPAAIVARTAATLLFADHGIYAGSAQGNRHVLTVTPPLSFSRDEADQLVNALETILSYNYVSLLWRTSRANRTARISVMK